MKAEDYLIELSKLKEQKAIGELLGKALRDRAVTPQVYEAMCNTAKEKKFKFVGIQLN
jgi:hypothetical protein